MDRFLQWYGSATPIDGRQGHDGHLSEKTLRGLIRNILLTEITFTRNMGAAYLFSSTSMLCTVGEQSYNLMN